MNRPKPSPLERVTAALRLEQPDLTGVVGHWPPRTRYKDTGPAIDEHTTAVGRVLASIAGDFLAGADFNSKTIQYDLARYNEARVLGFHIDAMIAAGLRVLEVEYVTRVAGVPLGTDHRWGALKVTFKRRGFRLARKRVAYLYNVRVGRPNDQVARELRAMLGARGTFAVYLCEASGYELPDVETHELVRDRSNGSRANLAAYVRRGHLTGYWWVDLERTWRRTEHPGQHDPRAFLVLGMSWKQRKQ